MRAFESQMTRAIAFLFCTAAVYCQTPAIQAVTNAGSNDTRLCPGVVANVAGSFGGAKATVTIGGETAYPFFGSAKPQLIHVPPEFKAGPPPLTAATTNRPTAALKRQ